jgi:hypothetical protein
MFVGKIKMAIIMLKVLCVIAQNLVDQVSGTCAPLEYHHDDLGSDKDDMEPRSNECGRRPGKSSQFPPSAYLNQLCMEGMTTGLMNCRVLG